MHRHSYQGRKFGRERDQRRSLLKGLATSLIEHGSIETTLEKAKELKPYVERLITKAKKADLHNRRQVIEALSNKYVAHKLVDEIAPKYSSRTSGHLTIARTRLRRGDNAQLATIGFVKVEAGTARKSSSAASSSASKSRTAAGRAPEAA